MLTTIDLKACPPGMLRLLLDSEAVTAEGKEQIKSVIKDATVPAGVSLSLEQVTQETRAAVLNTIGCLKPDSSFGDVINTLINCLALTLFEAYNINTVDHPELYDETCRQFSHTVKGFEHLPTNGY